LSSWLLRPSMGLALSSKQSGKSRKSRLNKNWAVSWHVSLPQAAGGCSSNSGRESRPIGQPARQKIARPQPAVRKYAAEAKQAGRVQSRTVQPDFEELPESTTKTAEGLAGKRKDMAEVPESKYLSEVLADFTDPEDLRMAILHYEILGKPLSLRDPSGQIIGLKL